MYALDGNVAKFIWIQDILQGENWGLRLFTFRRHRGQAMTRQRSIVRVQLVCVKAGEQSPEKNFHLDPPQELQNRIQNAQLQDKQNNKTQNGPTSMPAVQKKPQTKLCRCTGVSAWAVHPPVDRLRLGGHDALLVDGRAGHVRPHGVDDLLRRADVRQGRPGLGCQLVQRSSHDLMGAEWATGSIPSGGVVGKPWKRNDPSGRSPGEQNGRQVSLVCCLPAFSLNSKYC